MTTLILSCAAFSTSILSAVIGMGGGIILLAVMLLFFPPQVAIPLHAVVQLISNGTRTFVFLRYVEWKVYGLFVVPAAFGIFFVRMFFAAIPPHYLRILIALFIFMTLLLPKSQKGRVWGRWTFSVAGLAAGTLGMIVGAIGPVIAPFFLHTRILKERLIATKAVCQATVHLLKIAAFGTLGFAYMQYGGLILFLGVAVLLGTNIGKVLLEKMSESFFILLYKIALTAIGIKLLLEGMGQL